MMPYTKLKLFIVLGLAFLGYGLFFNAGTVEAGTFDRCGINDGDVHRYAGVVIDMRWIPAGDNRGNLKEANNTKVSIKAHGAGASDDVGGNIVMMGADGYKVGPNESSGRAKERTFSQISRPDCPTWFDDGDTTNVYLLGNGLNGSPDTSNNARNWGLDCDNSRLGGGTNYQVFDFTGVGVPDGAGPGKWNTVEVAATPNGYMTNVRLTYIEDPVPEGTGDSSLWANCNTWGYNVTASSDRYWYRVFRGPVSDANDIAHGRVIDGNVVVPTPGSQLNHDGAAIFGQGTSPAIYTIKIYENRGGSPNYEFKDVIESATKRYERTLDCIDDPPTLTVGADCNIVAVAGLRDPDNRRNLKMRYHGTVWYKNPDGSKSGNAAYRFDTYADAAGNGSLPFNAVPASNNGYIVDFGAYNINNYGVVGGVNPTPILYSFDVAGPCYNARCDASIAPNIGTGVKANQSFTVRYTVTNTGGSDKSPLISQLGGNNLTVTQGPGTTGGIKFPPQAVGENIGQNGGVSTTRSFNVTAPSSVGNYTIELQPDYNGRFAFGSACTVTIPVYQPFELVPVANIPVATPNNENPSKITYSAGVKQTTGGFVEVVSPMYAGTVPANVKNSLKYKKGTSTELVPRSPDLHQDSREGRYGEGTYNGVFDDQVPDSNRFHISIPDEWQAGDQFCSRADVTYSKGWIGPGEVIANGVPDFRESCEKVANRPYIRIYGSDAVAGGVFGGTGGSGSIQTYLENEAQGVGSGAEFAALAINTISGFNTASLRTSNPLPSRGLAFANMGPNSLAAPDHYAASLKPQTADRGSLSSLDLTTQVADNEQALIKRTTAGKVSITGGTSFSGHKAVFVEGDVYIGRNIVYTNAGSYATVNDIPAFDLMVKGNIYISREVTRLDGTYVAQPLNGSGGNIYTCSSTVGPGNLYTDDQQKYSECQNKLIVNGVFAAQDVKFLRTYKTLRDIPYDEPTLGNKTYKRETFSESAPPNDSMTGTGDYAAESFRLPPDYFMAKRALKPQGSQANGKFDYYVTLPPVL